ncbi:Hypothetical predicted protein [Octopus vulgaris]|uniref:Uncharacterized protein n=1 Tax=Octopus vulgaris TaxID=6645 RepID=A0AA36FE25_OCTVU|nr:Hypothetical predicted protein [Octopus vulgaris]
MSWTSHYTVSSGEAPTLERMSFGQAPAKIRKRADKGQSKAVSQCSLSRIKREAVKKPGLTSGELFKRISETAVPRTTRCRLLKKIGKAATSVKMPPLKKEKIKFAMVNFSKVFSLRRKFLLPTLDEQGMGCM